MKWIERHAWLVALVLTLIATVRIIATYTVFNHTSDEPAHIACGMEWLDKHVYQLEPQHPPLARVFTAIGPYLAGRRTQYINDNFYATGLGILYGGNYDQLVALARAGILPFFWVACLVAFLWTRRHFGNLTAVFAVLFFTMLPPVLAHAGLATTDMALTAFLGAAFLALIVWVESPGWLNAAILGVCCGLLVLSKFSGLVFFPMVAVGALAAYWFAARPSLNAMARLALPLTLTLAITFIVVWAGYRFTFGQEPLLGVSLPFPELFAGVKQVVDHNAAGHPAYLLGKVSWSGFWYYYPVVLAVKTPLPILALAIFGAIICVKRRKAIRWILPLVFVAGILVAAAPSRINIGVRHVLPVYVAFSILAAIAAVDLLSKRRLTAWLAVGAGVWMIAASALSHPDYLAYTNLLAGNHPEKVVVDSDLDWGQDMKRLGVRLRQLKAPFVYFDHLTIAYLEGQHGYPPVHLDSPDAPEPGYHAVSLTFLKLTRMGLFDKRPGVQPWPERIEPMEHVGKGIWLYYFPPKQ